MMPSSSGSGVAALIQRAKSVRVDGTRQPGRPAAARRYSAEGDDLQLLTLCLQKTSQSDGIVEKRLEGSTGAR
jgi:hypothetical protein